MADPTRTVPPTPPRRRAGMLRPGLAPPPALLVIAAAVSVQVGGALATHLFPRVGPSGAVTLRLGFAAVVLLAAAARRRAEPLGVRRGDYGVAVAFGLVLAGMNLAFYEALARVPLGVAVTIEFSGPLAVTIIGSRRRLDVAWAVLAGGGVFLLAGGGLIGARHLDRVGIAFGLLAGALWAAYIYLSAQVGRRFSGMSGLSVAMCAGALVTVPFGVAHAGRALLVPSTLGIGAGVALLSSALPYSLELMSLRRLTPRAFGVLLSTEPAIAALAGLAVLGQHLGASEVGALVLVVAANVGSSYFDARASAVPP